ncbi:MAG: sigma-54-dependent Fis family transcriptional regulator [Deltaproteobacteria bacterium]|nr:sigma-54-dependent Fis family transcriptional regulator [Deltaproteobacteria bacterium]
MSNKILIVDDEPFNLDLLEQELTDLGYTIERANNGSEALKKAESFRPELILLDYMMPDMNGLEVLKELRRRENHVPVVIVTAHGTIERAVQAMKEGAYDFVPKPFEPDHMALTVQKVLERERLKRGIEVLSEEVGYRYRLVVGKSQEMDQVIDLAKKAASSQATVLLLGESGTGKEIFARAIHNWSERKTEPFIAINCVGLSKELVGSELFGHEKGAFTGAHQLKKGKIELALGGTVFLDEIGDITPELQTKLLRFLQEKEFERVGGTKPIRVNARIVAATNRNLEEAVETGGFREDLYHRLNVISINLPSLRERREDITDLAHFFLERFSRETKKNFTEITKEAQEKLLAYDWPGNVRELANVMERAVVLGQGPRITLQDLPARLGAPQPKVASSGMSYHETIDAARRDFILEALNAANGNRAAAAKALGLHRTHLMRLIKTLQIE